MFRRQVHRHRRADRTLRPPRAAEVAAVYSAPRSGAHKPMRPSVSMPFLTAASGGGFANRTDSGNKNNNNSNNEIGFGVSSRAGKSLSSFSGYISAVMDEPDELASVTSQIATRARCPPPSAITRSWARRRPRTAVSSATRRWLAVAAT